MNRIILTGRLTRDPELRHVGENSVCNFRIAVDRRNKNRETDFIDVVAWNKTAEFVANYIGKGRLIAVDGCIRIRDYTDKDGVSKRVAEVVADTVESLDRPKNDDNREDAGEDPWA